MSSHNPFADPPGWSLPGPRVCCGCGFTIRTPYCWGLSAYPHCWFCTEACRDWFTDQESWYMIGLAAEIAESSPYGDD